jgi:Uma2 family endonuclease
MATATVPFVSVDEYLRTDYEPDADYVDGQIEERPMGEWHHTKLQKLILLALAKFEADDEYLIAQEQRVQVSPTRFRIPDTCVISSADEPQQIVTTSPLLCIEVLSPEDTYRRVYLKCQDYLRMGVPEVWIFDPETVAVDVLRGDTATKHHNGVLRLGGTPIELDLDMLRAAMVRRAK